MNLQKEFNLFNTNISVSKSKEDSLRKGRDSLRIKIKNEFKEKNRYQPKFHMQGSFAMRTMIKEDNYDIDDGIYIQGYENKDQEEWVTPATVHRWIYDAVENQTSIKPTSKNTCIRVNYKSDYHIDLPIYILKEDKAYLAHKVKGWTYSDPKKFTEWFRDKNKNTDDQLRRVVRYIKKWRDYKGIDLKGIEITILVGNNFSNIKDNDLKSLSGTIANINESLEYDFCCYRPIEPTDENLFDGISDTRKNSILKGFNNLANQLNKAINKKSKEEASQILRKLLGDEFPLVEDEEEKEKTSMAFTVKRDNDEFA